MLRQIIFRVAGMTAPLAAAAWSADGPTLAPGPGKVGGTDPAAIAAPADPAKRVILQRLEMAGDRRQMVTATIEIPAHTTTVMRTHPGEEQGYVLSG